MYYISKYPRFNPVVAYESLLDFPAKEHKEGSRWLVREHEHIQQFDSLPVYIIDRKSLILDPRDKCMTLWFPPEENEFC